MPANSGGRISVTLDAAGLEAINTDIANLEERLGPYLSILADDDKDNIFKQSDKSTDFVNKALDYNGTNPQFGPRYLDGAEFAQDQANFLKLRHVSRRLNSLADGLQNTTVLLGADAIESALDYYNGARQAAESGQPGARPVFDDLRTRFATARVTDAGDAVPPPEM